MKRNERLLNVLSAADRRAVHGHADGFVQFSAS